MIGDRESDIAEREIGMFAQCWGDGGPASKASSTQTDQVRGQKTRARGV